VNERTAQRMVQALREVFPSLVPDVDSERRRWWKLRDTSMIRMQGVYDGELVALETSIAWAERERVLADAEALKALRDRLLATLPPTQARRVEADAEAILEASGYAWRPGPRVKTSTAVAHAIAMVLKGPYRLVMWYKGARDAAARQRVIEPYGVLFGTRHYLVARDTAKPTALRQFRLDRITSAEITYEWFEKDKDFDLEAYAAESFGSFHSDDEFTRVVWRFTPAAAATARDFVFHPNQEMVDQDDGGLIVSFEACALVEMAWHLYQWGNAVEVIAPAALRELVAGTQNNRISVLP
jgi:predicted DNA-binding transcriptional regulator YafY